MPWCSTVNVRLGASLLSKIIYTVFALTLSRRRNLAVYIDEAANCGLILVDLLL